MAQEQTTSNKPVAPSDGKINFKKAVVVSGLSDQRFRKLTIAGTVPGAAKNADGRWRYDEKVLTDWAANRPKGGHGSADGRSTFKVRLNDQEAEIMRKNGVELKAAYVRKPKAVAPEDAPE